MLLSNCEFFCHEEEVLVRYADGRTSRVTESDVNVVREMDEIISTFYPEAYAALSDIYKASSSNILYYRFRIVSRFIRCNLANLDHVPDITAGGRINLESVPCPMRGECRWDGIICRPSFAHNMTPSELRVMERLYEGRSESEIADDMCLSVHTIHNHIHNALTRLELRSRAEFMKYAAQNDIFHGKI